MKICEICGNKECRDNSLFKCSRFKPKQPEETMSGQIQMTEEQARDDFRRIIPFNLIKTEDEEMFFESFITNMKNAGYILPNPVEEAEEMYENHIRYFSMGVAKDLIEKQHEAIQYLKEKK